MRAFAFAGVTIPPVFQGWNLPLFAGHEVRYDDVRPVGDGGQRMPAPACKLVVRSWMPFPQRYGLFVADRSLELVVPIVTFPGQLVQTRDRR